jgi:hypothetical protein
MEFNDNYPQYEFMAHHSEEEGKKARKKLWQVFFIMLAITIVELFIGIYAEQMGLLNELRMSTIPLKFIFIGLTIVKAYYIIYAFMHLGHENRLMKWLIIGPYTSFIAYLIFMGTYLEGTYASQYKALIDPILTMQAAELRSGSRHGGSGQENTGGGEHPQEKKEEHKTEGGQH